MVEFNKPVGITQEINTGKQRIAKKFNKDGEIVYIIQTKFEVDKHTFVDGYPELGIPGGLRYDGRFIEWRDGEPMADFT